MKYGPEELKQVADELLKHVDSSPLLRQRVLATCNSSALYDINKKRMRRRASKITTIAAAVLLVCAISSITIGAVLQNNQSIAPVAHTANTLGEPMTISADYSTAQSERFSRVSAAKQTPDQAYGFEQTAPILVGSETFFLSKYEDGKIGILDIDGNWIVAPEYDNGYIQPDGRIVLVKGENISVIDPSVLPQYMLVPTR